MGGVEAGCALRDSAVDRRDDARLGGGGHDELLDDLVKLVELAVREHEAKVALHHVDDRHPLRVGVVGIRRAHIANAAADHGVLAEDQLRLAAQGNADVGHLLGADEVGVHDKRALVGLEAVLKVGKVRHFLSLRNHPDSTLDLGAPTCEAERGRAQTAVPDGRSAVSTRVAAAQSGRARRSSRAT